MRLRYTTGLDADQFDEVVARVEELLPEPGNKPRGRKRKLPLADAVALTVSYPQQNSIQEVLGERWIVSQERVSGLTSYLTPLVEKAMEEFLPTEQDAADAVRDRVCLLDGSLGPCWSWREHDELWTRKQGTTGHNFQVITNLAGEVLYVSDPVLGSVHDSVAIHVTPVAVSDKRENKNVSRLRAPVERAMAHLKVWRILHTDYRRPLRTYLISFRAAIGLFFFCRDFQF